MPSPQAQYWLLTIPYHDFTPFLPPHAAYIKGQLERGEGGYLHWQLIVYFSSKQTMSYVKRIFGDTCHCERSRSKAASDYVWKEETRVQGTQFELGNIPFQRNNPKDWDSVLNSAKAGNFSDIPSDILIRCYANLKRIRVDHMVPTAQVREVFVFWGRTGSGKSRRAWDEASLEAYPKDPNSKFWDGYSGQSHVVIDEFRGSISISHMLRWLDRYPVIVEVKGSSCVLQATKIWITSNIPPEEWYPELDTETMNALRRRFTQIIHFN